MMIATLFLCGTTASLGDETHSEFLVMFQPQEIEKDFQGMGITRDKAFQIDKRKYVISGNDGEEGSEDDYGIRLFVIENNEVIFRSKGMMDSWYLNLSFFSSKDSHGEILILAEGGDEAGSYGFAVYELKNTQVKRIGYIDAAIRGNQEYLSSAVPFIEIAERADGYVFTFTRDVVVRDKWTYKYKTISRQSIRYIYDGKEDIKEIFE